MAALAESPDERPPTPPHLPTHGVRLSTEKIVTLVLDVLQEEVGSVEQLPSGKSFNNRIYFITLSPKPTQKEKLFGSGVVLKLPGWNFGADKIQNEVISLLLLEKYYPQIPVPRILAWSEGGDSFQRVQRVEDQPPPPRDESTDDAGTQIIEQEIGSLPVRWILMTRLPGQMFDPDQIEAPQMDGIMKKLAEYMALWRQLPAPTPEIGNLRLRDINSEESTGSGSTPTILYGRQVVVKGLLIGSAPSPMRSSQEYYQTKALSALALLKDIEYYAPNRDTVIPLVEELLRDILPNLALFHRDQGEKRASTFTHYDFSPRNILVSHDSAGEVAVSGIVDFEFAGFFPAEEEFTNTSIEHAGDWPTQHWTSLLEQLKLCGAEVLEGDLWEQACALVRIMDNIAPWQLGVGGVKGEALEDALLQAREEVQKNIKLLK